MNDMKRKNCLLAIAAALALGAVLGSACAWLVAVHRMETSVGTFAFSDAAQTFNSLLRLRKGDYATVLDEDEGRLGRNFLILATIRPVDSYSEKDVQLVKKIERYWTNYAVNALRAEDNETVQNYLKEIRAADKISNDKPNR